MGSGGRQFYIACIEKKVFEAYRLIHTYMHKDMPKNSHNIIDNIRGDEGGRKGKV